MKRCKVVLFGAGATGRAHVGLLAWQEGCELVLVERKTELVKALRDAAAYQVRLLGVTDQFVRVSGFRIYQADERAAIAREIVDADLVLTAVFDQNLPDVAISLAQAVQACAAAGRTTPINCVACENMMDSSSQLGQSTRAHLPHALHDYLAMTFGFPDCMISRVVPQPEHDPLQLVAEDYNEWTVRSEAWLGAPPPLAAMSLVDNQTAYLERKLFIHNGGHAVCAYFGFHRGHRFIHEAVADPYVVDHVLGALDQLGGVVRHKHGFSEENIDEYKRDLGVRGAIEAMRDSIARVVRDPMRKLSSHERLIAPLIYAYDHQLPYDRIIQGIVAALRYHSDQDAQSLKLGQLIDSRGLRATLRQVCDIPETHALAGEIEEAWAGWHVPALVPA